MRGLRIPARHAISAPSMRGHAWNAVSLHERRGTRENAALAKWRDPTRSVPFLCISEACRRSQMNQSHANRCLDLALEDGEPRSPLHGFFPPTLPTPSLDEALNALSHTHRVDSRTLGLARAKAKRAQAQRKYAHLSLDECTTIVIYTAEEEPREGSLYYVLNAALRAKERSNLKPWRLYIWLLLHALRKLPVVDVVIVFRGTKTAPSDLGLELVSGFGFTFAGFSSTAETQDVMEVFVGEADGPRTLLTLQLSEPVGRDVRDFSLNPGENEVLLPPNMCFEFVSKFYAGNGLTLVQCKQMERLNPILDMTPVPTQDVAPAPASSQLAPPIAPAPMSLPIAPSSASCTPHGAATSAAAAIATVGPVVAPAHSGVGSVAPAPFGVGPMQAAAPAALAALASPASPASASPHPLLHRRTRFCLAAANPSDCLFASVAHIGTHTCVRCRSSGRVGRDQRAGTAAPRSIWLSLCCGESARRGDAIRIICPYLDCDTGGPNPRRRRLQAARLRDRDLLPKGGQQLGEREAGDSA